MYFECIGCGYCCRRAPCGASGAEWTERGCSLLVWDERNRRWLCGKIMGTKGEERQRLKKQLAIGAGCTSVLNTYRKLRHVPTPEELDNEDELLERLNKDW